MTRLRTSILALALLGGSACVHPVSPSWRVAGNVLIPPGVSTEKLKRVTVRADAGARGGCPAGIRVRRKEVAVTMTSDRLNNQPAGWLTTWAEKLEEQGCIASGAAAGLATAIAQSLPLEMNTAFRLLYPADRKILKLEPGIRLQVMTPIMADGAGPDAPIIEAATTTSSGTSLTIDARFTGNVLGYETASYSVEAPKQAAGVAISVASVERHIHGQTERAPSPIHNYFQPLLPAAFYALFWKGGDTDFTALVVGGIDKSDFDRRMQFFQTENASSCDALDNRMCVAIPKRVAINPMVSITVNGNETLLNWGATVAGAIRSSGIGQPGSIMPQLSVSKPYRGRAAAVEFDHSDSSILNMILMGGEAVSWK